MTKVTLRDLNFEHMFSYGDNNHIQLDKNKITQLTAPNGVGKTSLALILQELLYSKNVKGIKKGDILHRYSDAKEWKAELFFTVANHNYRMLVCRKGATSKVTLFQDGIDISEHKIPDTYKLVQKILGNLSFEVFSQLTYQSSEKLLEFLKATDTNRKKFLVKLFNLERYVEIGEEIKKTVVVKEKELNIRQGELQAVENFLNDTIIGEKQELRLVPSIDTSLERDLENILVEIKSYQQQCKEIDKNNLYIQEQQELAFDLSIIDPEEPQIYGFLVTATVSKLQQELYSTKEKLRDFQKDLKKVDLADTCYVCGQNIDNSQAVEMKNNLDLQITETEEKIKSLNKKLQVAEDIKEEFETAKTAYKRNLEKIKRFEDLQQLINFNLQTEYPNYDRLLNTEKSIKTKLKDQKEAVQEAENYNEEVKKRNNQIDVLTQQKREFLARQQIIQEDIIDQREKVSHLNILKKAFSTTGLIAFRLESLTKELESTINEYLTELSDGQFQIIFRLDGEKLNIIVLDGPEEAPIETVSGGEFSRIQTAILLAIRNLLSKLGGTYINVLFLDEITGVLDEAGKEKLMEILLEEDNLNVFLISHDFTHPLIDTVEIVKEGKISKIVK